MFSSGMAKQRVEALSRSCSARLARTPLRKAGAPAEAGDAALSSRGDVDFMDDSIGLGAYQTDMVIAPRNREQLA